jgi:GT2 family glycosyltransferase
MALPTQSQSLDVGSNNRIYRKETLTLATSDFAEEAMNSSSISKSYDAFYYAHNCGRPYQRDEEWLNFFGSIAERIVRDIGPATVLDAGCAFGFLLEGLRARGVDAVGVDISRYAIEQAHADLRSFCWVGSITDPLPRRYDLIVSIEVLEHLSPREADQAIENICKHTDDVLFSSTPFDYKEVTHLNVRPPDYWAQRFAQHGFFRDLDFDASFITPWAVRYRKTHEPVWRVVYSYERQLWQLEKEVQARRQLTIEQQDRLVEQQRATQAHSADVAKYQQSIASLTEALNLEQSKQQHKDTEQCTIASFTAALHEAQEQTINKLLAQSAEQNEKLQAIFASATLHQNALEASVAQLLENGQTLETLRTELYGNQNKVQQLEAQVVETRTAFATLSVQYEESEAARRTLMTKVAAQEKAIQALKSREKGTELTINAFAQQRAEHEQTLHRLSTSLAERDAQLSDVNSSMAWYLYLRIKYPYLLALFRLYERIKYPYLLRVYRRLGLAHTQPPSEQHLQAECQAALADQSTFFIEEVAPTPPLAPHSASVDVIICVHNALEDVKRCLESVIRHTRMPYSLILIDDGSENETRAYLAKFALDQTALLIRNEQAKGYTYAANQGLRRSNGEYAVLLNSDTVVTPLWLDRMVDCAESDSKIGLVGPLSNAASWQSIPELFQNEDWADNILPEGFSVSDMGKVVGQYSARLRPAIPFLNGFCLMIKRGVIEQIGYFDEAVFGKGYGEENDFCLRARSAGWQLRVVDDAYVHHAQSRSYSHERRKELSKYADIALATKHEPKQIQDGVAQCRADRVLQGIRARSRAMLERRQLIESGLKLWEGKRVAFILTLSSACGGGNVVLDEAEVMRKMGVDARVLNLLRNRGAFERSYPDRSVPVIYAEDENQIAAMVADYDAVIATACDTVYWLKNSSEGEKQPVNAYYVQDFEPYFFKPTLPGFRVAWNSYTEHANLICFTKTAWNAELVLTNTGVNCAVVGAAVNIDLNRPRHRRDPDWPVRPLRIAAMIRPSTQRRNPTLTMKVLRELSRARGATVEIILFGCDSSDPEFLALPHDFLWRNAGLLTRPQVAALLNEIDIFADFSEFQAMGLTALEAMACGAAVIVPEMGGAGSFARHDENALIVDTGSQADCMAALERLTLDEGLRTRLQRQALIDACEHHPERAAYTILNTLFPTPD